MSVIIYSSRPSSLPSSRPFPPVVLALAVGLGLLVTRAAAAQRAPALADLPDLGFESATADGDGIGHSLTAEIAVRGDLGPQLPTGGAALLSLQDRLAVEPSLYDWLRLDSLLSMPFALDRDGSPISPEASDLAGRHFLRGRLGFGEARLGATGLDLGLSYRLEHGPDDRLAPDANIGRHDFVSHELTASIEPRRGMDDQLAWMMPFEYGLEARQHRDDRIPDALTHTVSSGFGLRQYAWRGEGWLEALGLSWSRTSWDVADAAVRPADDLNRLQLRLAHFDGFTIGIGKSGTLGSSFGFGASWLWDDAGRRTASVFEADYGVEYRHQDDVHTVGGGLSLGRHADVTPGGERVVAVHRVEMDFVYENREVGIGLAHRGTYGWLSHPDPEVMTQSADEDGVPRHVVLTEWFLQLSDFQLGVYHRADYGALPGQEPVDPQDAVRGWAHEAGVFLRLADLL